MILRLISNASFCACTLEHATVTENSKCVYGNKFKVF